MEPRKVILYISMSVDGFISTLDDDISWLNIVQNGDEDYGYAAFTKDVDTYIVGRTTYDVVVSLCDGVFPQASDYDCYIITRDKNKHAEDVTFYSGDLSTLIQRLKQQPGKNIYCDGGSEIVRLLMDANLIDEYIISVIPTILGDGKRLFKGGVNDIKLSLKSSKQYESGLVQLHYVRNT